MMTPVRLKGFQIFIDRHGKQRAYHRATKTPVDLQKHPLGSVGFFAECSRIANLIKLGENAKPGSLGLLIEQYRRSPDFSDLSPRTKADYQKCFDYLKPIEGTALARITPPLVVKIRDKAGEKHGRRFGNYVKTVLSLLFAWGVERGHLSANPAFKIRGIRRRKGEGEANRPWSDSERHAVLAALPDHMRLPIVLMMFCGLDPKDALTLPRTAINGDRIETKRAKTGRLVRQNLLAPVREALAAAPAHDAPTVCVNSRGRPWTTDGFNASWQKARKKLLADGRVEPGLTLKGLRHTVATILAEMGKDERTIADMLGQKTPEMARHYSRRADLTRKLDGVTKEFDAEMSRRDGEGVKPTL